jgi:hypothetical protein
VSSALGFSLNASCAPKSFARLLQPGSAFCTRRLWHAAGLVPERRLSVPPEFPRLLSLLHRAPSMSVTHNPPVFPDLSGSVHPPLDVPPPCLHTDQHTLLGAVDKLKFFLATAPGSFDQSPYDSNDVAAREERCFNRFLLPSGELVSCVLWNGLYHITGTDIVRALTFRYAHCSTFVFSLLFTVCLLSSFLAFGRPVRNAKKFEEGIFSDLRNLKSGTDATLEEPKVRLYSLSLRVRS